jgi:hypothetical protein
MAKNSKRRVFFFLRLRFFGGCLDPPDELVFFADAERLEVLRVDEPEDERPAEADAARTGACAVLSDEAAAFRSLAKCSVPFAAAKGSSALRFGCADTVLRAFQSRA